MKFRILRKYKVPAKCPWQFSVIHLTCPGFIILLFKIIFPGLCSRFRLWMQMKKTKATNVTSVRKSFQTLLILKDTSGTTTKRTWGGSVSFAPGCSETNQTVNDMKMWFTGRSRCTHAIHVKRVSRQNINY